MAELVGNALFYIIPNNSGEFWQALAALATAFTAAIALIQANPKPHIRISIDFCCGQIYRDQSVKLIRLSVLNCGKMPVYITGFGIIVNFKEYYSEVINPNNAPFYYQSLPVSILSGESKNFWISFDSFYKSLEKEKMLTNSKFVCAGYVINSFGQIKKTRMKMSFAKLTQISKIPNTDITQYKQLDNN